MAPLYDPAVISKIGTLEAAHVATLTESFQNFLSDFKALVSQEGLQDVWGVTLVHRHTNVPPGNRLFDFGQTLQPFPISDDANTLHGALIRPKSLALRDGELKAYEYEMGTPNNQNASFLEAVAGFLSKAGLGEHIGIRRYDPGSNEELEITEMGGISLKIPLNERLESVNSTRTFWGFPSGPDRDYRCTCNNTGSATAPNHNHIDCN